MADTTHIKAVMSRPERYSHVLMAVLLLAAGGLHLGPLLLATLFSYLALSKLNFFKDRGKWLATVLFLILVSGISYGFYHFIKLAVRGLPEIAQTAIPTVIQLAKENKIELPFTDYDSLRETTIDMVTGQVRYLGSFAKYARGATTQVLFLIAGGVAAVSIFLTPRFALDRRLQGAPTNLYEQWCDQLARRFGTFYRSFATVIGAQIVISAINTVFTSIFVIAVHLPYAPLVIGFTFLCGLLPVIGNLISNTIIVGIGLTVSPKMALAALIFLVSIHKLEYFLNSQIIGQRIRNPLWLTLLGLIIGERLMGIPGIILAPVVLNYIRLEMSALAPHDKPPAATRPTEREEVAAPTNV